MPADSQQPIIVIKKITHGGHHGGAWKVAYADFVTAMMALFIVLWLLNSNQKIQKAVGGYFNDPKGQGKMVGSTKSASGEGMSVSKEDMANLKQRIEAAMKKEIKDFDKLREFVEITVTEEGLRVELMESAKSTFFERGRPEPTSDGKEVLTMLASQLAHLKNRLVIEGHTDAKPFGTPDGYCNWELSSDRANAARRLMVSQGVNPHQIAQVRGFADQRLRNKQEPEADSNRRVSVIVRFEDDLGPDPAKAAQGHPEPKAEGGHH
ncbi:flagellar motor protein MotB [uncultured Paludibaculum sp.]|uniref:flagellar motor protein MotB n=1 Tax=uncultured Paludibaculum sp. TaxID=1765020 RepID=UPI002AAB9ECB|nr:flagellar motor protein MotB [uncultured Paludibaculum sp.]